MDREKELKSAKEIDQSFKFPAGKYQGHYVWDVPPTYLANAYFNWINISDDFKKLMLQTLIANSVIQAGNFSEKEVFECFVMAMLTLDPADTPSGLVSKILITANNSL